MCKGPASEGIQWINRRLRGWCREGQGPSLGDEDVGVWEPLCVRPSHSLICAQQRPSGCREETAGAGFSPPHPAAPGTSLGPPKVCGSPRPSGSRREGLT